MIRKKNAIDTIYLNKLCFCFFVFFTKHHISRNVIANEEQVCLSKLYKFYKVAQRKTPGLYLCIQVMMKDRVRQPGVSQGLWSAHPPSKVRSNVATALKETKNLDLSLAPKTEFCSPFVYDQQSANEVSGLLRRVRKLRLVKVPLAGQDVVQGLIVVVAKERAETTQTGGGGIRLLAVIVQRRPWDVRVYWQHVSNDAEAPHVRVEGDKVVVDDLRGKKLWSAKIHPQFLSGFIPVAGEKKKQCYISSSYILQWRRATEGYLHPRQTEVDDFDLICDSAHAKDVFWLIFATDKK